MKSTYFCSAVVIAVCSLFAGCSDVDGDDEHGNDDHDHGESAAATPSGAACPTDSTLTYESFGKAFMDQYCMRCHASAVAGPARNGAPDDHNFDLLSDIELMAEHIDGAAAAGPNAINVTMPPTDPKPSEAERRQLGEWLACGVK
jgi:cytochrome c5